MQSPCSARQARSSPNVGARATPRVGSTSSQLASRIARVLPTRSETGPHTQAPSATASTTTEIESPALEGLTPNVRESSGRIAWVEYMVANMPAAPSRNAAIPACSEALVDATRAGTPAVSSAHRSPGSTRRVPRPTRT